MIKVLSEPRLVVLPRRVGVMSTPNVRSRSRPCYGLLAERVEEVLIALIMCEAVCGVVGCQGGAVG